MKKVLILMLVTGMLAMTTMAFAGGGKVRGGNANGSANMIHDTDDAPGTPYPGWWQWE